MKIILSFILVLIAAHTGAQIKISPSIELTTTPNFFGGRFLRPFFTYEFSGNVISPGIKIEKRFASDKTGAASLSWSSGLYYFKGNVVGIRTANNNEFYSELNYQYINIPLIIRGELKFNPLFESNKFNFELGFQNSIWANYKLLEIASLKTLDSIGNVVSETVYQDENKLVNHFGGKYTLSMLVGFGVSFKRFDMMMRYTFSLSDYYSSLPGNRVFPSAYSLYEQERKLGRLKQQYFSAVISCRLF